MGRLGPSRSFFSRVSIWAYVRIVTHEKQLKLFAEQLGTFVNRAIISSLELYVRLHARIDDMEAQMNDRLKDIIVPDLAKFATELKKTQYDIAKLQQKRKTSRICGVRGREGIHRSVRRVA
ncbi:hypothetical protein HAX54_008782 [Datura stramonium]|uniref:Uncharacterized protein n=1 Tax=Datura stramonium TaxID=4076 RepID=A0ABS8WZD9_DATST|nr:hypothetical protein [Datura stramonium]